MRPSFFRCDAKDGLISRLGLAAAIEEQRIIGSPLDRPVIEPGIGIRDAPKGDAREGAAMLEEDAEESGVAIGQLLLDGGGQAIDVRIQLRILADAEWSGEVKSGRGNSGRVWSGEGQCRGRSSLVRGSQVGEGQVWSGKVKSGRGYSGRGGSSLVG